MNSMQKREMRREGLRRLAALAMLLALYVVLNRFVSIQLPGAKIGFSVLCPILAAMLYGPTAGALVYGLGDFISAMLFPFGAYHPGFTVTAAVMGLIWGIFCHPHPFGRKANDALAFHPETDAKWKTVIRAVIPSLINCLIFGLLINTLWVSQLYGSKTYQGWFLYRLPEYAVMIPVNVFLALLAVQAASRLRKMRFVRPLLPKRAKENENDTEKAD